MEIEFKENLHVSRKYVDWWKDEEAIREFFQNFRDATYQYLVKKYTDFSLKKVKWVPIDNKDVAYQAAPDAPATSFALTYDGVMVSFIRYQMGDLTFTNPGNFSMRCFILGGSDAKKHSKDAKDKLTLGKFGEGMKLAALAILRGNEEDSNDQRSIAISTGENYYHFFLENAARYDENCLFFHRFNRKDMESNYDSETVTVKITGMDKGRWIEIQKRFLDISPVPFDAVTIPEVENIGRILLSSEYASCMYLKGVFVCKDPYSRKFPYGIDLLEGELDRDRLLFRVESELIEKFDKIIGAILNARATNSFKFEPKIVPRVNRMFQILVKPQVIHWGTHRTLHKHLNKQASLRMLEEWKRDVQDEKSLPSSNQDSRVEMELAGKLPHYYRFINHYLFVCLKKCVGKGYESGYKPPTTWIKERLDVDETVQLMGDVAQEAQRFFPGGLIVKNWDWNIIVKKGEKHYIPLKLVEGGDFVTLMWRAIDGNYQIVNI